MTLSRMYESKIVKVHLLGASGPEYERPFKVEEGALAKMLKDATANAQETNNNTNNTNNNSNNGNKNNKAGKKKRN